MELFFVLGLLDCFPKEAHFCQVGEKNKIAQDNNSKFDMLLLPNIKKKNTVCNFPLFYPVKTLKKFSVILRIILSYYFKIWCYYHPTIFDIH